MDAVKRMFKVMPHSEYSKIIGSSSSKLLYAIATILAFAIPASSVNNPSVFYALAILAIITGYFVGLFEVLYQARHYYEFNGVLSLSGQYHLLFTAVFCFIVYKNRTVINDKIMNALAILNIVVFTLIFSKIPFSEFIDNIIDGTNQNIAYYLHMLSIVFIVFFWYLIYNSNKKEKKETFT